MVFSPDDSHVLVGEKSGNVYSVILNVDLVGDAEGRICEPAFGHLSLLSDIVSRFVFLIERHVLYSVGHLVCYDFLSLYSE